MSDYNFETITATAAGSDFYAWGPTPGQVVLGTIIHYDPRGGTDFNDNPCPQVSLELLEPTESITRNSGTADHRAGDAITITAGQASLRKLFNSIDPLPSPGDVLRIEFVQLVKTGNGMMKQFDMKIARQPARKPVARPVDDAVAPF